MLGYAKKSWSLYLEFTNFANSKTQAGILFPQYTCKNSYKVTGYFFVISSLSTFSHTHILVSNKVSNGMIKTLKQASFFKEKRYLLTFFFIKRSAHYLIYWFVRTDGWTKGHSRCVSYNLNKYYDLYFSGFGLFKTERNSASILGTNL